MLEIGSNDPMATKILIYKFFSEQKVKSIVNYHSYSHPYHIVTFHIFEKLFNNYYVISKTTIKITITDNEQWIANYTTFNQ